MQFLFLYGASLALFIFLLSLNIFYQCVWKMLRASESFVEGCSLIQWNHCDLLILQILFLYGASLSLSLSIFEKAIFLKCLKLVRNLDGFSSSKFYFRNLPHNLLLRIWAVKNCTFWHQLISEQGLYTCLFDLPCNLPSICGDF